MDMDNGKMDTPKIMGPLVKQISLRLRIYIYIQDICIYTYLAIFWVSLAVECLGQDFVETCRETVQRFSVIIFHAKLPKYVSSHQKPDWLLHLGDCTTQLYGDSLFHKLL